MTTDIKKDSNYWSQYDFTKIPYNDLVKVGQRTLLYRDLFSVSWLLGRFCNYKCSYCWPYARSDRKDHRPTELCLATIDEIKRQARDNGFNSFHFSLSGGEPTFHPGYLDILLPCFSGKGTFFSIFKSVMPPSVFCRVLFVAAESSCRAQTS